MIGRCRYPTGSCHLTLTSFLWFSGLSQVWFFNTVCNRSTLFGNILCCTCPFGRFYLTSFLPFIAQYYFFFDFMFSQTISNKLTTSGVWTGCKVYNSICLSGSLFLRYFNTFKCTKKIMSGTVI